VSPTILYLHGFASGPGSKKGVAVAQRFGARGVDVQRLDLRIPTIERLSLGAMIARTRAAIGGPADRAVLIGSSLGGLTAARVAAQDPRVCMLVLLAPAFRFADRWKARLGPEGWAAWMRDGWLDTHDHATGGTARVHADFAIEAAAIDDGWPDVRIPTLVIHGVHDDVVPVENSRTWAAGKRHVRLVELDDGHELVATLPVVLAELERFLAPVLGEPEERDL
jgi:pimeloyl-ACP methyl ester carboxylesterase